MIANTLSACITTKKVKESSDFYVKHFGAKVTFDCGWYVNLQFGKETSELQFMAPREPGPAACNPAGLMYNFCVDDVDAEYKRLTAAGLTPIMPLEDHPWGDRGFALLDPNGVTLYIYSDRAPSAEFEPYFKDSKAEPCLGGDAIHRVPGQSFATLRGPDAHLETTMPIRPSKIADVTKIFEMYRRVAAVPGGLARLEEEISEPYINMFIAKSLADGIALVAEVANGKIVGEIHAYSSGLFCFSHVLTDLTVAVDPNYRQQGVARSLFERFFGEIERCLPHINRVELISRASNTIAIQFYETLGFKKEGRLENRIKNVDGSLEADIPMGWTKNAR